MAIIRRRRPTTVVQDVRRPVAPLPGVGGELPPPSFLATCERMRAGPRGTWSRYRERCTGIVPWNLPGRSALPEIPLVGVALNLASGLVPGGGFAAGALGLTGGQDMPNGYEPWIGVGGWGVGVCPPGQRCIGGTAGGLCLGTCVPSAVGGGPEILPGTPGIGPVYGNGYGGNGGQAGNGAGMQICCPQGKHPNKTGYFTKKDGWVEPGTKCVPNRRTNPLNPRAASRAGRRLRSAAKASKWLQKCKIPKR
jgi:hypothetical protein